MIKRYIAVMAVVGIGDDIRPVKVYWHDGRSWTVQRVGNFHRAYEKVKGQRHPCWDIMIAGQWTHLFKDDVGFFVMEKV